MNMTITKVMTQNIILTLRLFAQAAMQKETVKKLIKLIVSGGINSMKRTQDISQTEHGFVVSAEECMTEKGV